MEIREKLKILKELQEVDDEIMRLKNLNKENPVKIEELDNRIAELEEELAQERSKLENVNARRLKTDKMLNEKKALLEQLKKKQFEVKTNEQYQLIQKDIKETARLIDDLENELLDLMVEREKEEKEYRRKEEEFNKKKKEIEEEKERLRKEMEESSEKIIIKEDEKKRISARLRDEALLNKYERIRTSRGGKAVAIIEEAVCTGCYSTIPPQIFVEIKRGDKIFTCDVCGRILIYKYIE